MRKSILIAAMVLASAAAAQAGDSRSLSRQNPGEPPAATNSQPRTGDALQADNTANTAPAPAETPRYAPPPADTTQPADTARNTSNTPRYTARPAATTASSPSNERAYHRAGRNRQAQMYRQAQMQRQAQMHRPHRGRLIGRIVAALHRHGIYW